MCLLQLSELESKPRARTRPPHTQTSSQELVVAVVWWCSNAASTLLQCTAAALRLRQVKLTVTSHAHTKHTGQAPQNQPPPRQLSTQRTNTLPQRGKHACSRKQPSQTDAAAPLNMAAAAAVVGHYCCCCLGVCPRAATHTHTCMMRIHAHTDAGCERERRGEKWLHRRPHVKGPVPQHNTNNSTSTINHCCGVAACCLLPPVVVAKARR